MVCDILPEGDIPEKQIIIIMQLEYIHSLIRGLWHACLLGESGVKRWDVYMCLSAYWSGRDFLGSYVMAELHLPRRVCVNTKMVGRRIRRMIREEAKAARGSGNGNAGVNWSDWEDSDMSGAIVDVGLEITDTSGDVWRCHINIWTMRDSSTVVREVLLGHVNYTNWLWKYTMTISMYPQTDDLSPSILLSRLMYSEQLEPCVSWHTQWHSVVYWLKYMNTLSAS